MYGPAPFPLGAREFDGYLALPDGPGAWPTVVVLPGLHGIGPLEKALARHLAKHGKAAAVLDTYRGAAPGREADLEEAAVAYAGVPDHRVLADIGELREYLVSPDTHWADDRPSALVGLDVGGRFAILAAAQRSDVAAVAVVSAPLRGDDERGSAVDVLDRIGVPLLGLYGADDELVPIEDVDEAQTAMPHAKFIVYEGVGHGFLDPSADDYHPGAEADALARIRALLDATVPTPA